MLQQNIDCVPFISIVDELKGHIDSMILCYKSYPWIFMRNPLKFQEFIDEMIRHIPGMLKQEMKNDLIEQILKSKDNENKKHVSDKNNLRKEIIDIK